jgi:hypothetical protein
MSWPLPRLPTKRARTKTRKASPPASARGLRKGSCGECRLDAHCTDASKPICDPSSFTCRACQKHSECSESLLCNLGGGVVDVPSIKVGQCVPISKVVFVDADRCPRGGPSPTGSSERPFCEITNAVGKGEFIVVKPRSSGLYSGLGLSDGKRTTIVGPGRDVPSPVQIAALSVTGSQTALVVSDVVIRGDTVGLMCGRDGSLWVLRSLIQNSSVGIDSLGCNRLVVEQSIVLGNRSLGLRIGTGTRQYRVINNVCNGNGQSRRWVWRRDRRRGEWAIFVQHHPQQRRKGHRRRGSPLRAGRHHDPHHRQARSSSRTP